MAIYGFVITLDTESGEYELQFNNVSNKGEPIDYYVATEGLKRVLDDFTRQVNDNGDEMDGVDKEVVH